jgi:hypothetical protein
MGFKKIYVLIKVMKVDLYASNDVMTNFKAFSIAETL